MVGGMFSTWELCACFDLLRGAESMREQSFRLCWALGRWDGIGIRFDGSRHGLGIDILRMGDGSRWE